MPLRHPFRRFAAGRLTVGITLIAGIGAFIAAPTVASAAPMAASAMHSQRFLAAPFSFSLSSGNPAFGFVKEGTVIQRQFDLLNDGDNDIAIDPAPLVALKGAFVAKNISFTKTTVIPHNGHASFTITFTVPSAGATLMVPVALTATDQTDNTTKNLAFQFSATTIATDPAHFTATTTTGTSADFGKVTVGGVGKSTITLKVDGVIPLRFSNADILITDTAGNPLPDVKVSASSFGTAGANSNPGETATLELTYAPSSAGLLSGSARITGTQVTTDPERSIVNVSVPLIGSAVIVPVTPPPTTPAATATPATPGATHTTAVTAGGRGSGGGGLAETGLPIAGLIGLAGLLATGGAAAVVTKRRRAKA